jgi:glutathione S-transferase
MEYAVIIILLALLQYTYFSYAVGSQRVKLKVAAPLTEGNDVWQRYFRVQQNTLEQLIVFIPSMLAFSHYVSSTWVILPGAAYLVGRQLYAHLYVKAPKSRAPGFLMTFFANMALVIGSLIGVVMQLVG